MIDFQVNQLCLRPMDGIHHWSGCGLRWPLLTSEDTQDRHVLSSAMNNWLQWLSHLVGLSRNAGNGSLTKVITLVSSRCTLAWALQRCAETIQMQCNLIADIYTQHSKRIQHIWVHCSSKCVHHNRRLCTKQLKAFFCKLRLVYWIYCNNRKRDDMYANCFT